MTLLESEMPVHTHTLRRTRPTARPADAERRRGRSLASANGGALPGYGRRQPVVQLAPEALAPAGGDQPHNNMQPYLTLNFCIALQGVFPPRT